MNCVFPQGFGSSFTYKILAYGSKKTFAKCLPGIEEEYEINLFTLLKKPSTSRKNINTIFQSFKLIYLWKIVLRLDIYNLRLPLPYFRLSPSFLWDHGNSFLISYLPVLSPSVLFSTLQLGLLFFNTKSHNSLLLEVHKSFPSITGRKYLKLLCRSYKALHDLVPMHKFGLISGHSPPTIHPKL